LGADPQRGGVHHCPDRDMIIIRKEIVRMGSTVPGMTEIRMDWRVVERPERNCDRAHANKRWLV
jgi:hypothetical protein